LEQLVAAFPDMADQITSEQRLFVATVIDCQSDTHATNLLAKMNETAEIVKELFTEMCMPAEAWEQVRPSFAANGAQVYFFKSMAGTPAEMYAQPLDMVTGMAGMLNPEVHIQMIGSTNFTDFCKAADLHDLPQSSKMGLRVTVDEGGFNAFCQQMGDQIPPVKILEAFDEFVMKTRTKDPSALGKDAYAEQMKFWTKALDSIPGTPPVANMIMPEGDLTAQSWGKMKTAMTKMYPPQAVEQMKNFPWVRDMLASLVENGSGSMHYNVVIHGFSAHVKANMPGFGQLPLDLWDAIVGGN
jgi:hypothetical protein